MLITMRPDGPLRQGFNEFVATLPPGCLVLEIGSYAGESAELFLARACTVWCVDPWHPYVENNDPSVAGIHNFGHAEKHFDAIAAKYHPRIVKVKTDSLRFAKLLRPQSFHVIYLDGLHEEIQVTMECLAFAAAVKPGGILAGHDYGNPTFSGVQRAVDQLFGKPDAVFPDTTWLIKGGCDGPLSRLITRPER